MPPAISHLPVLSSRTRCRPSPGDRLSRSRTPTTAPPGLRPLSRRPPDPPFWPGMAGGAGHRRFPRSPHTVDGVGGPALSLRYRHESTPDLPRGLLAGDFTRPRRLPSTVGVHRNPAHIHQAGACVSQERLYPRVPHVRHPVLLADDESCWLFGLSRRTVLPARPNSSLVSRRPACTAASLLRSVHPDQSDSAVIRSPGRRHPPSGSPWRGYGSPT